MLVLDTDHLSLLEMSSSSEGLRLRERLDLHPSDVFAATIISYEEQVRGRLAYLARTRLPGQMVDGFERLKDQLETYCRLIILNFDTDAAIRYGQLRQAKLRVGSKDLQIAAIVLAHDATLLTRNLRHFRRVPDLRAEDWTL